MSKDKPQPQGEPPDLSTFKTKSPDPSWKHYVGMDDYTLCGLWPQCAGPSEDEDIDCEEYVLSITCPECCKIIIEALKENCSQFNEGFLTDEQR